MPEFSLSFEVYCADCGEGLCNQSETTVSRIRGEPQVRVAACQQCMNRATEPLEEEIESLKTKLEEAQAEINVLHQLVE